MLASWTDANMVKATMSSTSRHTGTNEEKGNVKGVFTSVYVHYQACYYHTYYSAFMRTHCRP
jgi:hypothetical protein